jgi:hypothetical protein
MLLPFLDQKPMFDTLQIRNGVPWLEPNTSRQNHQTARETVLGMLLCPTAGARDYNGNILKGYAGRSSASNIKGALTSYKGMGGTVKESLPFKIITNGTQPYSGSHPDGVMYADVEGCRLTDVTDSQSQTIMVAETTEDKYSRWMIGTEATLAGLPSQNDPARAGVRIVNNSRLQFYAPENFDGGYDNDSKLSKDVKTYLNYDYKPQQNKYDKDNDIKYGPSSRHAGVVNHLFCDGNARSLPTDIDPAAYMFLITKAGSEQLGAQANKLFGGAN